MGRLQPDGKRLENAGPVGPGWILVLPPAAHGPLVHFGPLPLTGAAARSALSLRPALPTRPAEAAGGSTGSGAGFAGFLVAVLAGPSIVAGVVTFLLTRRSRRPVGRHQLSGDPDF